MLFLLLQLHHPVLELDVLLVQEGLPLLQLPISLLLDLGLHLKVAPDPLQLLPGLLLLGGGLAKFELPLVQGLVALGELLLLRLQLPSSVLDAGLLLLQGGLHGPHLLRALLDLLGQLPELLLLIDEFPL